MAYIDKPYYRTTYKGIAVTDDTTLDTLIMRAEEIINLITNDLIVLNGLSSYATYIQTKIKTATCKQVEYYVVNGYATSIQNDNANVSIGNFSISQPSQSNSIDKKGYSADAINILSSAGLIVRGVHVCY
jgi:hypothetical protein